jgi:hypothetical protein
MQFLRCGRSQQWIHLPRSLLLSDACVAMYRHRTVDVTTLRFIPACDDTVIKVINVLWRWREAADVVARGIRC